jgi:hypothetical protein
MSPVEHEPAATRAAVWARTLAGLRDTSLQVGWVRDQIAGVGAARAADVLTVVLARAEQREERYATLLLRVSLALATPENLALKRAIAGVADVRGQTSLARFLGGPRVEGVEEPKDDANDVPDFGGGAGRKLTLGERKSLARKRDRNLLARALRDPDPDVIRILLGNPALVEEDIVRLCARRPVQAKVLMEVFLNQRWVLRYRVRLALALNPFTPEHVVLQLVPHLAPSDLRELAQCSHTSERVRAACYPARDLLQKPVH